MAVSHENVDKARDYLDAYNRRDFEAATASFHPEIEFILPDRQSSDNCHGTAEIIRFWEGLDETFTDFRVEQVEHVDGGDRIATRLRYFGRGMGSGLEIETEMYHQVATFQDGVIVRLDYFGSWPEALAAMEVGDT